MHLASKKVVLSPAGLKTLVAAVSPLKSCVLFQLRKHLPMHLSSKECPAARFQLSRPSGHLGGCGPLFSVRALHPLPPGRGYEHSPHGAAPQYLPFGSQWPRRKRAKELPAMGCRELTSTAGPAL